VTAFLALWNDVERGREPEYDEWHTREHVPERVSSPGFRAGRRYVNRHHPLHRYFTLYEVEDLGSFRSAHYRDLLDNPTAWSASMRPAFRNFLRVPCMLEHAEGYGLGAALAVLRITSAAARDCSDVIVTLVRSRGVVAARLGRHVMDTPAPAWRGAAPDPGTDAPFDAVLVLEALDRDAAQRGLNAAREAFGVTGPQAESGGTYDLAFIFPGTSPDERFAHCRRSWDVMPPCRGESTT
jgi:hypothetical protein